MGNAALNEQQIYEKIESNNSFFRKIESFLSSIFASITISLIASVMLYILYKTACCCIMTKKCQKQPPQEFELAMGTDDRIARLEQMVNVKFENLEARIDGKISEQLEGEVKQIVTKIEQILTRMDSFTEESPAGF